MPTMISNTATRFPAEPGNCTSASTKSAMPVLACDVPNTARCSRAPSKMPNSSQQPSTERTPTMKTYRQCLYEQRLTARAKSLLDRIEAFDADYDAELEKAKAHELASVQLMLDLLLS